MVKTAVQVLPDVAEVTINTMINPASGLLTLVQKVAQRVAKSQEKKAESQEPEPAQEQDAQPADPVVVDARKAAEALEQVRDQLSEVADSPEKELVEEALQRLDTEGVEGEGEKKSLTGKVAEAIGNVAEALPDVVEVATDVLPDVAEAAAGIASAVAGQDDTDDQQDTD